MQTMIYCPICGNKKIFQKKCPTCGYEEARDYEMHPTLGEIPGNTEAVSARRLEWQRMVKQTVVSDADTETESEKKPRKSIAILIPILIAGIVLAFTLKTVLTPRQRTVSEDAQKTQTASQIAGQTESQIEGLIAEQTEGPAPEISVAETITGQESEEAGAENSQNTGSIISENTGTAERAESTQGAGTAESVDSPETTESEKNASDASTESAGYIEGEQTILDTDYASVTITGYMADSRGFHVKVRCENKHENPIRISLGSFVINKYLLKPLWIESLETGETTESEIKCYSEDLEKIGITTVDEILLTLKVADSTTYETLLEDNNVIAVYPTGKTEKEIIPPEYVPAEDDAVVLDDENCKLILRGVDSNMILGFYVNCYYENKSDHKLAFLWQNTTLNGQQVVSNYTEIIPSDIRGYGKAFFTKSTLNELGLTEEDISEVGFTLYVFDMDNGTELVETADPFTYQVPKK